MINILFLVVVLSILLMIFINSEKIYTEKIKNHKCSSGCSSNKIDDLMNPAYNMKSIIEQSILLEEHLAIPSKRCNDCITKHFCHINGLASESLMLACNNSHKYPYIKDNLVIYNELLNLYLNNDDDERYGIILDKLRTHRKKLMKEYIK
jgi:hypothetical protein